MTMAARIPLKPQGSEKGVGAAKPGLVQEPLVAGFGLGGGQARAPLQKRHLGRKVAAFANLNAVEAGEEVDEVTAPIAASPHKPEGMGHDVVSTLYIS
jgi:hypothetical protein